MCLNSLKTGGCTKTLKAFENKQLLKNVVSASVGIQTDDNDKFLHFWWEVFNTEIMFNAKNIQDSYQEKKWFPYNKGGEFRKIQI